MSQLPPAVIYRLVARPKDIYVDSLAITAAEIA